jgi:hypothetical protein
VLLAPTPRDEPSVLCDASWPSCTRAAAVSDVVLSNGETTITVRIRAPATEGSVKACFGLVTGAHWFSDPGANGPQDSEICRTITVTTTAIGATEEDGDGGIGNDAHDTDDRDVEGGCACRATGKQGAPSALALLATAALIITGTARRRFRRRARPVFRPRAYRRPRFSR